VTLLLLRHVHAGDRSSWSGPDHERPVSNRGRRQALALVEQYAEHDVAAVLSSPYVRCVQSVEPLAAARELVVEEVDELAEGAPLDVVSRLLRRARRRVDGTDGAVVLCTHGDVLQAVTTELANRGVHLPSDRSEKAATWVIGGTLDDPDLGYLPPPA
jgi:phosphohistidine phosphatase SixA